MIGGWLIYFVARQPAGSGILSSVPIMAALLVSVGWVTTALLTNWNNQREHTIATISSSKDENAKKWDEIRSRLPDDQELPLPDQPPLSLDKDDDFYKKVMDQLLNDFDFIALGVFKGVYDESMMYSALANDFIDLYNMTTHYIRYVQIRDKDNEVWVEFERLSRNWIARPPRPPVSEVASVIRLLAILALLDAVAVYLRWH